MPAAGQILIRGAEEPAPLASPTTISGTNDGGILSGGSFSTPPISFERQVTASGITTDIAVRATFTQVSPGSATGTINDTGDIALALNLRVDLDIDVAIIPGTTYRCVASPVALELRSVVPYDPADGGSVTLADSDFTIPPVTVDDECIGIVGDGVNQELAGSGHALTLPVTGALTVPLAPGEPTLTDLTVSPGESSHGDPVTLTATVSADQAGDGVGIPTGIVDFKDRGATIASVELDPTGTARATSGDLLPGTRRLSATYRGVPEIWAPSDSPTVTHRVAAAPLLTGHLPPAVHVGGDPVPASVSVTNTGYGSPLSDLDLTVTIRRTAGSGPIGPDGATPRLQLDRIVDETATPVPLTLTANALTGTVRSAGSWHLAPGADLTEHLTLQVSAATEPGPLEISFSLVRPTTEGPGEIVATTAGPVAMVAAVRQPTQVYAGDDFFFPAIVPNAARQGTVLDVNQVMVAPTFGGTVGPTGYLEFLIDGVPVPSRLVSSAGGAFADRSPVVGGATTYSVQLPSTTPTGTRQVAIHYSGDDFFAPSQAQYPVRIEPSAGSTYECVWSGSATYRALVNVQARASLPAAWPVGTEVPISHMDVRLLAARSSTSGSFMNSFIHPDDHEQDLSFGLGPDGAATATSVVSANSWPREFEDGSSIDHTITFGGITGSVAVEGAPGETVDVTLESIDVDDVVSGSLAVSFDITCTPIGAAIVLDRVVLAGATLEVEPGGSVRTGRDVTLRARVAPVVAGTMVEFRDGGATIGMVPVGADGTALLVTDELPEGVRELTVRSYGGISVPSTVSEPVVLRVEATRCGSFAQPGSGAIVRLVYLELLGRCPDPAGSAYWVDRLDGGASPEVFARSIARTPEALGVVVDEAYRTVLGRAADPAGRAFWVGRMAGGSGRFDQLLADLAASPEFWSRAGGSEAGFVTRVYERLLGRAPEEAGLAYWVGRLGAGVPRGDLVRALANLDEPLGVQVAWSYEAMLARGPGAGERGEGVAFLRASGDRSGLLARLIGTPEFFERAQGFPNPS